MEQSKDEDIIIPLDAINQSQVNEREPERERDASPEREKLRICGVTRGTAIAARIILFVFIVITMTSLLLLIYRQNDEDERDLIQHHHHHNHHLKVIKKSLWSLGNDVVVPNATVKLNNKETIAVRVYVNATSTPACRTESECFQLLRKIEMEPSEFAVNFWISSDGSVFEDYAWTPSKRIFISFIGDRTTSPSTASLQALENLLESGVATGHLDSNYKIIANKNFSLLSKEIQKSSHWNSLENWLSD